MGRVGGLAFLVMVMMPSQGVVAGAMRPATQPPAIEIVTTGPEPSRGEMQVALRTLLGGDADLVWSGGEAVPAKFENESGEKPRIWIDVANAAEIRIVVPTTNGDGRVSIRTVPAKEGDDPAVQSAARETVAQIVGETVRALRDARPRVVAAAPTAWPVESPAGVVASVAVPAKNPVQSGSFEVTLSGGTHTAPFKMAEPSSESNWLGPSVQGQIRWRKGNYRFAFRAGWERSEKTIDDLWLGTRFVSTTVAALRSFQVGRWNFGLGLEAGGLFLWQRTELANSQTQMLETYAMPGTLGKTQSGGVLAGPLAEVNLMISERWFLHAELASPVAVLKVKQEFEPTNWGTGMYARGLLGIGLAL